MSTVKDRDLARREARGDAWADAIAALAEKAPKRLTAEQARIVKTNLRLGSDSARGRTA